ncbi:ABC transporter permease [Phytoactinopolyspora halotolerans]|uniref:ABC transporter permease n=1 Tax=Phytoactinopolyspora halotolerans TaxID=1981512 RepID=A0A6L9S2F6_9ACTN|nr:ABC transporter permease [Phytoactinopolyspora halotolerans]NED99238.1 ABC transporter permease [Phytoactinopolyspora halotolerans]
MTDRRRAVLRSAGSKTLSALIVLYLAATVAFLLVRISGDPLAMLLPPDATQEQSDEMAATLGLDQPLIVQYLDYLGGLVRLDLGDSIFYGEPVSSVIADRLPATALLAVTAMAIALLIAVPAGIFSAMHRGKAGDKGIITVILIGQSTPAFWVGILLVLIFAVQLQVLPAAGYGSVQNLVLPAVTLAVYSVAVIARLLRSSLIDVLSSDYMRTATAKGYGPTRAVLSHGLRNASLPVITVVGLETGSLLGGAILTEQVFGWPGLGRLTVEAISNRDLPLVQGTILLFAAIFVVINLVVDLSYSALDPRVRLEK